MRGLYAYLYSLYFYIFNILIFFIVIRNIFILYNTVISFYTLYIVTTLVFLLVPDRVKPQGMNKWFNQSLSLSLSRSLPPFLSLSLSLPPLSLSTGQCGRGSP